MNRSDYVQMFEKLSRTRTKYTECIRITRVDGTVYRFTAHDRDLVIREPNEEFATYKSANAFSLTSLETQAGLVVSNMDIDGLIDDDDIADEDLRLGFFDNANVELFIAYWSERNIRVLPLRTSWVGEIQVNGPKFKVDLRGIAQRLAQTFIMGTSLECRWTFCDGGVDGPTNFIRTGSGCGCGLTETDYTDSYTIASVDQNSRKDTFEVTVPAIKHNNYYQWGKCRFTGGNNDGVLMEILYHYENRIKLFLPVPYEIEVGDTVQLVAGCDKTWTKCGSYNNRRRFGGEPFLRGNDMLARYPYTPQGEEEE